ncbi:MAG TPA: flavin reductase family protein [Novosphingobium sp.]|nr:flavin reductase family protein [Novosphingobium sp.]
MAQQAPVFDSGEFRRTLGLFTTGVTIITARGPDGERVGLTANSFSSVSLDPPLVLWSLAKTALSRDTFERADHFAVHILSAGQEDLSNRFAARGSDKFSGVDIVEGIVGTPLLSGCCARMQCRTVHRYEGGDHIIFVGEVIDLQSSALPPLVFQAGKYALASRKVAKAPFAPPPEGGFEDDSLGYMLWRATFQFFAELRRQPGAQGIGEEEFLLLATLAHSNWRSPDTLARLMFHREGAQRIEQVLGNLAGQGLLEWREPSAGIRLAGLNAAGLERARAALAAA